MTVELSTRSQSIKKAYEANNNTNAFTDNEKGKLVKSVISDSTNISGANEIVNIVSITQSEYDALTPDSSTLYIIEDA